MDLGAGIDIGIVPWLGKAVGAPLCSLFLCNSHNGLFQTQIKGSGSIQTRIMFAPGERSDARGGVGRISCKRICQTQPPLLPPAAKQIKVINLGLHPLTARQCQAPQGCSLEVGAALNRDQGIFFHSLCQLSSILSQNSSLCGTRAVGHWGEELRHKYPSSPLIPGINPLPWCSQGTNTPSH